MTKTYAPTPQDYGNAALDDVSFGGADYAQSLKTGENLQDIRSRTANSQAALGPMGPIVNAMTYAIPGTGEMKMVATPGKFIGKAAQYLAPKIGRYGAAAAEGGTASALSSIGHQAGDPDGIDALKVAKDTAKGAAGGVVFQGAGDVTAPAIQRVGTYVTGKPGTGGEQWPGGTNCAIARRQAIRLFPMISTSTKRRCRQMIRLSRRSPRPKTPFDQSVDPGRGFQAVQGVTALGAGALGLHEGLNLAEFYHARRSRGLHNQKHCGADRSGN